MIESKIKGKISAYESCMVRWEESKNCPVLGEHYRREILTAKEILKELKDLLTN